MSTVELTKFFQSAFVLRVLGKTYAFDFGSESSAEIIDSLGPVDAAFVSHSHSDHFDISNLRRLAAPIFGPVDVTAVLKREGLRSTSLTPGETVSFDSLHLRVLGGSRARPIRAD